MRAVLALLLSLILTLASQTEAVARSEMAGSTDHVLCSAEGATTVTLDAAGNAIHAHPCTHCLAAGVVADLSGPAAMPAAPVTRSTRLTLRLAAQTTAPLAHTPIPRAPPVLTH